MAKNYFQILNKILCSTLTRTSQMQALQEALAHDDLANIEAQQAKLKPLSDAFAASIMNQSVKTSMAGTSAKDW